MPSANTDRWAAIFRDLDIPAPFDLECFVSGLKRRRGRSILMRPFTADLGMPCGLWISIAEADYIYYAEATTRFHQTHIVMHEVAHMLLGHRGQVPAWEDLAPFMSPGVDLPLIQLMLRRTTYGTVEEQDAETLASLILSRRGAWTPRRLQTAQGEGSFPVVKSGTCP